MLIQEDVMEFFRTEHLEYYNNNSFMCYIPSDMDTYGAFMLVDLK